MTDPTQHRRLREPRGAVLRGAWVLAALAGGLMGAVGLQLAGERLENHLARVLGLARAAGSTVGVVCPVGRAPSTPAPHRTARTVAVVHLGMPIL